ncbi:MULTISPECIES: chemotaxis protein CheW [unclassified Halanaerobium]|uniref:chemotaxis protein CheW n=1 Tax=unclassified Halanaerobium TaxID=2641197 RepID=UPI000DF303FD|nr:MULTISPECIES: chemotaxis protein CheW [unclassified Halanaerobium]RCW47704.1 purine-binding chemotaxis protein CheW [Halanaerobium sp. MA284_MarDTE_T2]RCW84652.1 purine-binding chemotaxis protein CheW [Halanaerobium sp. DL-01]
MVSLTEAKNTKKQGQMQYVVFNIGQEEYGIEIDYTREIIKSAQITNVPNAEKHVLGVINLRGIIVPVIDLHKRFEIKTDESLFDESESRIITVEVNDVLLGLQVDRIEGIVWLDLDKITPAPDVEGGLKQDYLTGVCARSEEQLLILLDLEKTIFA